MTRKTMMNALPCQPVSLSHVRHELRTPINAILGYSEMLIEDLEDASDRAPITSLQKIYTCGQQLLVLINSALTDKAASPVPALTEISSADIPLTDASLAEISSADISSAEISSADPSQPGFSEADQLALAIYLDAILSYCNWLTHNVSAPLQPDIEKILKATNHLQYLLNNLTQAVTPATLYNTSPTAFASPAMLPLHTPLPTAKAEPEAALPASPSHHRAGHLLVVDDNENNRELLSRQLSRQGYRVETAINGEQALVNVANHSYDLILLDILMPELNGYDVLDQLMQHKDWRRIPVIMISALGELDSVVRCIDRGAADYLTKPFNPVILNARISSCLEKKRLHDLEMVHLEQLGAANAQMSHYLQEVDRITAAAAAVESNTFNPDSLQTVAARTDELGRLARVFTHTVQAMGIREQELRIAEAQYRSIFENALEGIFQSNQEGHFLNVNPALAKIYGYDTPVDMLRAITDISGQVYVDPQARIDFLKQMQTCDELKNWEYQIYRKDGSMTWVEENTRAVRDRHGQILYFEGIVQDISDRIYREKQLRRQLKELQIEIDQEQRNEEVVNLTSSHYFQEVQKEVAAINLEEFWT